jgi:hypothetical protein
VSLALQAGNPNSGTSSFFINLGNNTFLDSQGFVPFAEIRNMGTVDEIMELAKADLSDEAGQAGSLAFTDVPIRTNGRLVVVTDVDVIEADPNFSFVGPIASALQLQQRNVETSSAAALAASSSSASLSSSAALSGAASAGNLTLGAAAVPEPSTAALGILGALASLALGVRRMRG